MKPSEITRLARSIPQREVAQSRFLLRWIGWEALQHRVLIVACHANGWAVSDAEDVLDAARISSMQRFREALEKLVGSTLDLNETVWNKMLTIEMIRNKFVHGLVSPGPEILNELSKYIESVVIGRIPWGSGIRTESGLVNDFLAPRRGHRTPKSRDELLSLLGVKKKAMVNMLTIRLSLPSNLTEAKKFVGM